MQMHKLCYVIFALIMLAIGILAIIVLTVFGAWHGIKFLIDTVIGCDNISSSLISSLLLAISPSLLPSPGT